MIETKVIEVDLQNVKDADKLIEKVNKGLYVGNEVINIFKSFGAGYLVGDIFLKVLPDRKLRKFEAICRVAACLGFEALAKDFIKTPVPVQFELVKSEPEEAPDDELADDIPDVDVNLAE